MVEVATPSKVCFPLIYVFFEVMLMSGIDGIRSCLEDYILLFLFDVCRYVASLGYEIFLAHSPSENVAYFSWYWFYKFKFIEYVIKLAVPFHRTFGFLLQFNFSIWPYDGLFIASFDDKFWNKLKEYLENFC